MLKNACVTYRLTGCCVQGAISATFQSARNLEEVVAAAEDLVAGLVVNVSIPRHHPSSSYYGFSAF